MVTCPENTIAAFKSAIRLGAQMIEFDVRESRDGRFFVSHEFTLEHIDGRKISPSDLTWVELRKLDVGRQKEERFTNERIPSLEETLGIMPSDVWIFVHLWSGDLDMARKVSHIVSDGRQHQVILGTTPDRIRAAREVCSDIKTLHWSNECPNSIDYVDESMDLNVDFVRFWSMEWAKRPLTKELVDRAREAGMKTLYCQAGSLGEMRQLFEMGVDFLIVDCALKEAMDACKAFLDS
jgi:glycerophosphoryl diester phosphodiesterase